MQASFTPRGRLQCEQRVLPDMGFCMVCGISTGHEWFLYCATAGDRELSVLGIPALVAAMGARSLRAAFWRCVWRLFRSIPTS
eukprot:6788660-Prymnesium_polylepis.1